MELFLLLDLLFLFLSALVLSWMLGFFSDFFLTWMNSPSPSWLVPLVSTLLMVLRVRWERISLTSL